ncbi:MAG: sigma-70 family RNA polymerase sigma factor [Anaerolineaceae bacterium]
MNTTSDLPIFENLSDDEIIRLASEGSNDAFGLIYQRYITAIYNYIYYRTGDQHDAEDLSARVFHRAYGHISSYKYMGLPISAWLYRIAHNLVANYHRDSKRKREVNLEDHLEIHAPGDLPETVLIVNQETEELMSAIHELTPDRQQLIILKFVEHLSNLEIAVIMGRSEGAIKSLYHRTLISLKTIMDARHK